MNEEVSKAITVQTMPKESILDETNFASKRNKHCLLPFRGSCTKRDQAHCNGRK